MKTTYYPYHNGFITIKTHQCTDELYQCVIGWDFGTIKCIPEINRDFDKKDTYYKIIQYEIKKCIQSLNKIKCKRENTKLLIASLIHLHQEISKEQFKEQTLF